MQPLTPNQLKYILTSVAWPVRPTLQFAYYFPENKRLVSTDAFRLHELSIDLWEEPWIIDKDGTLKPIPKGYSFPQYERFFSPKNQRHQVTLFKDNIHTTTKILKAIGEYGMRLEFATWDARESINSNHSITFRIPFYRPELATFDCTMGICAEYLYDAIRFTKEKKSVPAVIELIPENPLSPLVVHVSIDWVAARSLIMPLKI